METLLIAPTLKKVNATLKEFCDAANKGQRVRTAEMVVSPAEWRSKTGRLRAGGDGVANAYRGPATTTVVGCVWVTLPDRRRVVRVYAARDYAPHSAYGRTSRLPFGFNTAHVRWGKASPTDLIRDYVLGVASLELREADPGFGAASDLIASGSLGVVADWLEEHGRTADYIRVLMGLNELMRPVAAA